MVYCIILLIPILVPVPVVTSVPSCVFTPRAHSAREHRPVRDMGKWKKKSVASYSATDAQSSRGVIISAGLCPYNRGVDAAVAEGVILCESCGPYLGKNP